MGGIRLDDASEYYYSTLIEAMEEVEMECVEVEDYEKAAMVRDELKALKNDLQLKRIATYTGRNLHK